MLGNINRIGHLLIIAAFFASLPATAQTVDRAALRAELVAGAPTVSATAALDPAVLDRIVTLLSGYEYFPTAEDLSSVTPDPTLYLLHIAYDPDGRWLPTHHHRALAALAYFPSPAVRDHLTYLLESPATPELMRHHVVNALATGFGETALVELEPLLRSSDLQIRLTAVSAIGSIHTPRALETLEVARLAEPDRLVLERIDQTLDAQATPELR